MDFTQIHEEDDTEEVLKKRPSCLLGLFRLFLVFLLIPLFIVMALLPTLLSSDPMREWALKEINAAIAPAEVSVQQWSLGWLNAPVLENVRFSDAAHGADFKVDLVSFDRGLLRLLPIGVLDLGSVTLKNPVAAVSLALTPQPPKTQTEEKAGKGGVFILPVADIAAVLNIENGRVKVTGKSLEPFEAQQINVTAVLESYRKPIGVQTQMRVGGGTLTLEGRVQSLQELVNGKTVEKPEKLTLKLSAVDLTAFCPLIEHASGEPWIHSGVAEGALTATVSGVDQFSVEGGVLVTGLSVAAARQKPSPPGDLALMMNVDYDKKVVSVTKFELSSPWLRAHASGKLQQGKKAGVMIGTISAKAESDLAVVARDFSSALGLSKGFKMQKGQLQANIELAGSETSMAVDANLTTADLAMTIDGEPLALKPAPSLAFKAKFPYGAWPEVETLTLKAPFADVYASGRFDAAVVKGRLDLTLLSRDFKRMMKNAPPMVGAVFLDMATKLEGERVAVTALLKVSDLAAELMPGRRVVVPQGALKIDMYVPLKDGKPESEIQDASFAFTLESGRLYGGWRRLSPAQGDRTFALRGFTLTSDMELGSVRRLLGGFIPTPAQRRMNEWQGHVIANATAEAAGGVVKARMNAAGQQIVAGTGDGVWRVPDIRMEGSLTQNSQKEGLRFESTVTGSGALERDGATVFAEKDASLAVEAQFATDYSSVQISKMDLTSSLFDIQAHADVTELSTRFVIAARGKTSVNFAAVTSLLEAKGFDQFQLTGRELREFSFASPLAGGVGTIFSDGEFSGAAFVGSLKGMGLNAGSANATLRLAKGRLKVAYEPALNEGKLRLIPEMTVERGTTTLSFPAQTRLLENVKITQEMVEQLIVNVNPLFQGSVVQNGTVTLDLKSCRMESGPTPANNVSADIGIVFKNLKLELGPSLRDLLATLKVKDRLYSVEQLPIHAVVKDGRITVDPIRMVIDKQPVIFSGWVAFDRTIKYLIEVPVTDRMTGGTGGSVLKGMTIKIPVTGTVDSPQLDSSVLQKALGKLLKSAASEHAAEKIGTFLEKLQKELQK